MTTVKNFKNAATLATQAKERIKGFKKTEHTARLLSAIRKNISEVERLTGRKTPLNETEMAACSAEATQARYRSILLTNHTNCVEFCESMGINTEVEFKRNKYGKFVEAHSVATTGKSAGKGVEQKEYMTRFIEFVMKGASNPLDTKEFDPIEADWTISIRDIAAKLGKPCYETNTFKPVAYNTQPAAVCNVLHAMGYAEFTKNGANGTLKLFADSPLVKGFNKLANA